MSDNYDVYNMYLRSSGAQKKNKEWTCLGCGDKWTCTVGKLRAHILRQKDKGIKPCPKYYSPSALKPMQDLDAELAQTVAARKRQRAENEVDPLLDPALDPAGFAEAGQGSTAQQPMQLPQPMQPPCVQRAAPAVPALPLRASPLPLQPSPSVRPPAQGSTLRQLRIPDMQIAQRHDRANLQLGMMFYGCGIPFNVARSPLFTRAMQSVAECGPGFKPVGYNALRGPMLNKVGFLAI